MNDKKEEFKIPELNEEMRRLALEQYKEGNYLTGEELLKQVREELEKEE